MKQAGSLVERLKRGESIPDRHHNPYIAEAISLSHVLFTADELKEKGASVFADPTKPLVLEIGCYMGKTVLDLAQANPHVNVLGIDITYKRCVKAARKIHSLHLPNAAVGICEAQVLLPCLPDGALSCVAVFFPDPWPKKRHLKNRLVKADFFALLGSKLAPGGSFWFKTDSADYFQGVLEAAHESHWTVSEPDAQPPLLSAQPYVTVFESLFIGQELPIHRRVFSKEGSVR